MREWCETVAAVDRLFDEVTGSLYAVETERRFVVTDTFDRCAEFVESVSGWRGTYLSPALRERAADARPPLTVDQEVRLRLLVRDESYNIRRLSLSRGDLPQQASGRLGRCATSRAAGAIRGCRTEDRG
jgi:hypothetical protein